MEIYKSIFCFKMKKMFTSLESIDNNTLSHQINS